MKLGVTLDILNQKATPAFYADTLANRPAAGYTGRVFISTDTYDLYRDTGTTWVLLSPSSTGTITGSGAAGQVTYFSGTSSITGDNNLFWDSVNGHLGIKTITPDCALDVNHNGTFVAKFNNTSTANTLIGIYNLDNPQWLIGSNSVANDLTFYDATNFPTLTATTTMATNGTTYIGGQTAGSGRLNVYSATSDNGIQISGANAPSLRIDNAPTAPTKRIGLGISTAVNNFIQGSVDRDMCIFNGSTTASPILFGVYDTTNVAEAARISASRNLIIGKTTDSGERLQVQGTANFSSTIKAGSFDVPNGNYFRAQQNSGGTYQVALGYLVGTDDLLLNFSSNLRVKSLLGSDLLTIASSGSAVFSNTLKAYCPTSTNQSGLIVQATAAGGAGSQPGVLFNNNSSVGKYSLYLDVTSNTLNFGDTGGTIYQTLTAAGNIGIGTSTPSTQLHLYKSSGNVALTLQSSSNYGYFINDGTNISLASDSGSTGLKLLVSRTAPDNSLLVTTSGNILIGTTTDNGSRLRIVGGQFNLQGFNANSSFRIYDNYSAGAVGAQLFNTSGVAVIDLNGNAGNINITGSISTGAPSGGTSQAFKSGSYVAGAPAATGYVQFEVNGVTYKLLAST